MININNYTDELTLISSIIRNTAKGDLYNPKQNENDKVILDLSFISKLNHDFRSPLTVIQLSTEILESFSDRLTVEQKKIHYQKVYDSISKLSELLDNVSVLCQSDKNSFKPQYENLEIISISKKIIEKIRNSSSEFTQINFHPNIKTLNVFTDKKIYSQILTKLISFVIKHNPSNNYVDVSIEQLKDKFILEVECHDIKTPEIIENEKYTPFFGAANINDDQNTDSDIAIVQQSIKILSGEVFFVSDDSREIIFTITIPVNGGVK